MLSLGRRRRFSCCRWRATGRSRAPRGAAPRRAAAGGSAGRSGPRGHVRGADRPWRGILGVSTYLRLTRRRAAIKPGGGAARHFSAPSASARPGQPSARSGTPRSSMRRRTPPRSMRSTRSFARPRGSSSSWARTAAASATGTPLTTRPARRWRVWSSRSSPPSAQARPDRLRICANDDCRWAFEDTSRAGRRRWCDMTSCGNVAKARRYRARHRGTEERGRRRGRRSRPRGGRARRRRP